MSFDYTPSTGHTMQILYSVSQKAGRSTVHLISKASGTIAPAQNYFNPTNQSDLEHIANYELSCGKLVTNIYLAKTDYDNLVVALGIGVTGMSAPQTTPAALAPTPPAIPVSFTYNSSNNNLAPVEIESSFVQLSGVASLMGKTKFLSNEPAPRNGAELDNTIISSLLHYGNANTVSRIYLNPADFKVLYTALYAQQYAPQTQPVAPIAPTPPPIQQVKSFIYTDKLGYFMEIIENPYQALGTSLVRLQHQTLGSSRDAPYSPAPVSTTELDQIRAHFLNMKETVVSIKVRTAEYNMLLLLTSFQSPGAPVTPAQQAIAAPPAPKMFIYHSAIGSIDIEESTQPAPGCSVFVGSKGQIISPTSIPKNSSDIDAAVNKYLSNLNVVIIKIMFNPSDYLTLWASLHSSPLIAIPPAPPANPAPAPASPVTATNQLLKAVLTTKSSPDWYAGVDRYKIEDPKCECGAKYTQFPNSHMQYCPLFEKR